MLSVKAEAQLKKFNLTSMLIHNFYQKRISAMYDVDRSLNVVKQMGLVSDNVM